MENPKRRTHHRPSRRIRRTPKNHPPQNPATKDQPMSTDFTLTKERTHRYGHDLLVGTIPDGYHVCHTCDNPPCCNPSHWFLGTNQDNVDDRQAKGRGVRLWGTPLNRSKQTHCKQGHPLSGPNLIVNPKTGHRSCRDCQARRARIAYRRKHGLPGTGQPRPRKEVTGGEVNT